MSKVRCCCLVMWCLVVVLLASGCHKNGDTGLHHIVCVRLKASTTPKEIDELKKRTIALKSQISVIEEITAGSNLTNRSRGYNFAIVVKLSDRKALDTYLKHPAHLKLLREIAQPLVDEILVLDFEI